jgi:catechol 2,3-dioxygenase-like lactoylglutathione lyase family enzyme
MDGNAIYLWEITPEMDGPDTGPRTDSRQGGDGPFFGGHANIYVSNMDRSIRFYTEVLGLMLTNRFEDHWATVEAGRQLVIGIHPQTPKYPPPGTKGSTVLSLTLDQPIDRAIARLTRQGVKVNGSRDIGNERAVAVLEDPDGNPIELRATLREGVAEVALTGRA